MRSLVISLALFVGLSGLLLAADLGSDDPILKDLKSDSVEKRLAAMARIEKLDVIPPDYIPVLLEQLQQKMDKSSQRSAAFSFVLAHKTTLILAKAGPAALPGLRKLMRNDEFRWQAVEVVQRMGEAALPALPDLIDCLADKNENIRYFAAKAIMQFGPKAADAVPALIRCVNDPCDSPRQFSIQALGEIGAAAKPALPALEKAKESNALLTKIYAEEAVQKINQAKAQ